MERARRGRQVTPVKACWVRNVMAEADSAPRPLAQHGSDDVHLIIIRDSMAAMTTLGRTRVIAR